MSRRKIVTDKQTDYLFAYFINENKFNEQLRGEWDDEMEKKLANQIPKIIEPVPPRVTEKKNESESKTNHSGSHRSNVEFNSESSSSSDAVSVKSPYSQKIEKTVAKPFVPIKIATVKEPVLNNYPPQVPAPVVMPKLMETPEERRARAREKHAQLEDIVEKHNVKLSKKYTIDDDPDDMEAEYEIHKERRNRNNQVKFYKQILLNIICGVEFVNDKYNPFDFKLTDWSKQIATDLDDYTEVLEEIYEKYKSKGGKLAPELRLLFMIIMSGITFHLSKILFGAEGLKNLTSKNPNILNSLLNGLMKGGTKADSEPVVPTHKKLLETIREQKKKGQTETNPDATETLEHEKKLLEIKRRQFEEERKRQNDLFQVQMEQLKNQQEHLRTQQQLSQQSPVNKVLSPSRQEAIKNVFPFNQQNSIFDEEPQSCLASERKTVVPKRCKSTNLDTLTEDIDDIDSLIKTLDKSKFNNSNSKTSVKNKGMTEIAPAKGKIVTL